MTDDPRWPLGMRLEVLPGQGVVEQFANAHRYGFDCVELPGRYFADYLDELKARRDELALPVSSISLGLRGSLVSADPESRKQYREDTKGLFALCAELGGVGVVIPPLLHMDNHPRLDGADRLAKEDALLLDQLPELGDCAAECGVALLLEAVNPDERPTTWTPSNTPYRSASRPTTPGWGSYRRLLSHAVGEGEFGRPDPTRGKVAKAHPCSRRYAGGTRPRKT